MNSFLLLVVCVLVHPHTQHALAAAGTGVAQRQQGGGSLIQGSCTALQFPPFDGGCKSGDEVASPMRCRLRGGGEGNDVAPTTGQELYNIAEERFASIVRAKRAGEGKGGGGISSCIKWLARTIGGRSCFSPLNDIQPEVAAVKTSILVPASLSCCLSSLPTHQL